MGFHVQGDDSPDVTPTFHFNAVAVPTWCGRVASELGECEVGSLLMFCQSEAERIGWNDARNGCVVEWNPFHASLLDGQPHEAWRTSYMRGVSQFKDHQCARADAVAVTQEDWSCQNASS